MPFLVKGHKDLYHYREAVYFEIRICRIGNKMPQYELDSKTMSYSHGLGTALR